LPIQTLLKPVTPVGPGVGPIVGPGVGLHRTGAQANKWNAFVAAADYSMLS
jgi:hypothetical protein